jgi:hypothetical protein
MFDGIIGKRLCVLEVLEEPGYIHETKISWLNEKRAVYSFRSRDEMCEVDTGHSTRITRTQCKESTIILQSMTIEDAPRSRASVLAFTTPPKNEEIHVSVKVRRSWH